MQRHEGASIAVAARRSGRYDGAPTPTSDTTPTSTAAELYKSPAEAFWNSLKSLLTATAAAYYALNAKDHISTNKPLEVYAGLSLFATIYLLHAIVHVRSVWSSPRDSARRGGLLASECCGTVAPMDEREASTELTSRDAASPAAVSADESGGMGAAAIVVDYTDRDARARERTNRYRVNLSHGQRVTIAVFSSLAAMTATAAAVTGILGIRDPKNATINAIAPWVMIFVFGLSALRHLASFIECLGAICLADSQFGCGRHLFTPIATGVAGFAAAGGTLLAHNSNLSGDSDIALLCATALFGLVGLVETARYAVFLCQHCSDLCCQPRQSRSARDGSEYRANPLASPATPLDRHDHQSGSGMTGGTPTQAPGFDPFAQGGPTGHRGSDAPPRTPK